MFTILYKSIMYAFEHEPFPEYEAGQIVTFCNDRTVRLCTSKDIPCGFAIYGSQEINIGTITVAGLGEGEYMTDMIEPSEYFINDFLYCSDNGKLSNEPKYRGNIIIGIVNSISDSGEIGFLTRFAQSLEQLLYTDPVNNIISPVKKYNNKFDFLFKE